jgi:chromosomal replication initiation ATPase DnaA
MNDTQPTWRTRPVLAAVEAAAAHYRCSRKQVRYERARFDFLLEQRQLVMWLARQQGASYSHIGHYLGRDHSTCIAGVRTIEKRRQGDPVFRQLSDELLAKLQEARS